MKTSRHRKIIAEAAQNTTLEIIDGLITECQQHFGFKLPRELIEKKKTKFVHNYNNNSLNIC